MYQFIRYSLPPYEYKNLENFHFSLAMTIIYDIFSLFFSYENLWLRGLRGVVVSAQPCDWKVPEYPRLVDPSDINIEPILSRPFGSKSSSFSLAL